jgi:hypothetical protein
MEDCVITSQRIASAFKWTHAPKQARLWHGSITWTIALDVGVEELEEGQVLGERTTCYLFGLDGLAHAALAHDLFEYPQILHPVILAPCIPDELVQGNFVRKHSVQELAEGHPVGALFDLGLIEAEKIVEPAKQLPPSQGTPIPYARR